jgi:hypothetical protein
LRLCRIDRVSGISEERGRQRGEERREDEPAAVRGEILQKRSERPGFETLG